MERWRANMALPVRIATGLLAQISAVRAATAASSSASGATRLTRPKDKASAAEMKRPVTSMSKACLGATLRERATAGVEQNRPTLMPETAKVALSAATARSQVATSWQPAAVAMPCTRAITGTGQIDDALHDPAALGEQGFVVVLARIGAHLLEVVPGAEGLAGRRENDAANGLVVLDIVERRLQRRQHLLGQGVELGRPVEGQRHDSVPILAQQNGLAGNGLLGTHDDFLLTVRARCLHGSNPNKLDLATSPGTPPSSQVRQEEVHL